MGVAITQWPELFDAVVVDVPPLDMQRYNELLAARVGRRRPERCGLRTGGYLAMKRTVLAATSGMAADLGAMGHLFESHYDLHYWLYRPNPSGELAQFTPDVNCEHHEASM